VSKKKGEPTLTDQLRDAIRQDGRSLNELGRLCGVDAARLSRFVRGERGLSLDAVDKIAAELRLRLVKGQPAKPKGKQT
jgi:transcriptional regulator with XRE-family HTH domain